MGFMVFKYVPSLEISAKMCQILLVWFGRLIFAKLHNSVWMLFFWLYSTKICVFYPMVYLKYAKSLYSMFTELAAKGKTFLWDTQYF